MIIWRNAAAALASKVERLQEAERHLLEFVGRFDPVAAYEISPVETEIPHDVVPLSRHGCDVHPSKENDKTYRIHALRVTNQAKEDSVDKNLVETPLVFLHGYMNGAAYFYRNFAGLSRYFRSIYSVDLLGWGLSSRPNFRLLNDSVETTEDFFVESLEAWRRKNGVERMILAGHSMGGYLSVAYCERYPQHVERLILISPAGVIEESAETLEARRQRMESSIKSRLQGSLYQSMFHRLSVGEILRALPSTRGQQLLTDYVKHRLPAVLAHDEQTALSQYLYRNNTLPGSGEYCVSRLLNPWLFGREATEHRIPRLQVPHVSFVYGESDWMDAGGGLQVKENCVAAAQQAPLIDVYQVSGAGHLVMLDNFEQFNTAILWSAGIQPANATTAAQTLPTKLYPGQRALPNPIAVLS